MKDLSFEIELRWSGTGREGAGEIQTDDVALELSAPELMGGRGADNPEELLVRAVSSCYAVTLFGVLRRAKLPADSVAVSEKGTRDPAFQGVCGLRAAHNPGRRPGASAGIRGGGRRRARSMLHRPHARTRGELRTRPVQVRDGAACAKNFQIKTSSSPQASSWRAPSRPRRLERNTNAFTRRCSVSSRSSSRGPAQRPTRTIGR